MPYNAIRYNDICIQLLICYSPGNLRASTLALPQTAQMMRTVYTGAIRMLWQRAADN